MKYCIFLALLSPTILMSHEIRLHNLWWQKPLTCDQYLESISEEIAANENINVTSTLCEYSPFTKRYTGKIFYEADERLTLVDNTPASRYAHGLGYFDTQEHCQEQLEAVSQVFQYETGLEVRVAFCAYGSPSDTPWYPYLAGFGQPSRTPDVLSWYSSRPYDRSEEQVNAEISSSLANRGITVGNIGWHLWASGQVSVSFYRPNNEENLWFHSHEVATIMGLESCRAARLRILEAQPISFNTHYVTSYCASNYSNPVYFDLMLVLLNRDIRVQYGASAFKKLSECSAARPEIDRRFRSAYPDNFVATFCEYRYSEDKFHYRVKALLTSNRG